MARRKGRVKVFKKIKGKSAGRGRRGDSPKGELTSYREHPETGKRRQRVRTPLLRGRGRGDHQREDKKIKTPALHRLSQLPSKPCAGTPNRKIRTPRSTFFVKDVDEKEEEGGVRTLCSGRNQGNVEYTKRENIPLTVLSATLYAEKCRNRQQQFPTLTP